MPLFGKQNGGETGIINPSMLQENSLQSGNDTGITC